MTIRQRVNFKAGTVTSLATSSPGTATTITGNNFPTPPSGYYVPITLNPGYFGATNTSGPEIAYITNGGSSTVANVTRQLESSTAASGTNVPWVAGPLVSDFDVYNLTSSGSLTLSNGASISGALAVSGTVSISGSLAVSGTITAATSALGAIDNTVATTQYVASGTGTFGASGSSILIPNTIGQIALITLSGYNKYLIHGDLTITNNDSSNHVAYLQFYNQTTTLSSPANSTYVVNGQRSYIGTSWIVSGYGTGSQTIQLQSYIGGSVQGTGNNYDIYAIGLT